MALVTITATAITTVPVLVTATASLFGLPTTVTTYIYTTIIGLPGQTVTIIPPPDTAGAPQATPFAPDPTLLQPQYTITVTEIDAFVEAPNGNVWTSIFYDESGNAGVPTPTSSIEPNVPGEKVIMLPDLNSGWASWSTGEKAGLCAGVVLVVLGLLLLWWCCLHRRQEWTVQPRGTYWNGGYGGAGLRGAGLRGAGGRWNIRQIALKWKDRETARCPRAKDREETGEGRSNSQPWQTDMQLRSAMGLEEGMKGFLDGIRDHLSPVEAERLCSGIRQPHHPPSGYPKVSTRRSQPYVDDPLPPYGPTHHDQAGMYSESAPDGFIAATCTGDWR